MIDSQKSLAVTVATVATPEGALVSRPIGIARDVPPKRRLPLLTNSSLTTFRRCPREYYFRYVLNRKARRKAHALYFGSLMHRGLNAWWNLGSSTPVGMPTFTLEARLVSAVAILRSIPENEDPPDPFNLVKAEVLMAGYTTRWGDEPYETIAVEKQFRSDIVIAGSRAPSYELGGSIDAIVRIGDDRHTGDNIFHNVEHKTTSADISAGSDYWRHVIALDSQISTYDAASRAMGYDIRSTIYDVIRKPELQPLKATPEESKKYTKPTKAEPVPRLYANQRETDETPDEYRTRLTEDIIARPEWYFQRNEIVRLDHDNEAHAIDVTQTASMIRFAEDNDAWPRSPNACERYRRLCDFFSVCAGECTIDDGTRYEHKTSQHEELE